MAQHNEFGQISEDRAAAYLMARGYTIRNRNWRVGHKEIDIIAQKDGVIVFIEVKTRKSDRYERSDRRERRDRDDERPPFFSRFSRKPRRS